MRNKIYFSSERESYMRSDTDFKIIIAKDKESANKIGYDRCADPKIFIEIGETNLLERILIKGSQRAAEYWDIDFNRAILGYIG